jgi:hypothetical protein
MNGHGVDARMNALPELLGQTLNFGICGTCLRVRIAMLTPA